jgi:hypothetical protein
MATLRDLKPDPRNARKRTDRSASLIQESLQRFGAARSIVIDEDNRILAGNGTVEGAKAAGIEKVRIIEASGDELVAVRRTGLTEEQKIGLALADNRTSDLSDWDPLMLQQLSETHDVSPWFEPEDLNALIGDPEPERPSYTPILNPIQGSGLGVTDEKIAQQQEKLDNQFIAKANQNLVQITCPHCDETFTLEKESI